MKHEIKMDFLNVILHYLLNDLSMHIVIFFHYFPLVIFNINNLPFPFAATPLFFFDDVFTGARAGQSVTHMTSQQ